MAVPQQLLQQLLALDESARLEIAHVLLESVDASDESEMSDNEREALYTTLERSIAQADAGQTVLFDEVIAELRAKRVPPATR